MRRWPMPEVKNDPAPALRQRVRQSPRFYAVEDVTPPPPNGRRARTPAPPDPLSKRYILLAGPFPSRSAAGKAQPGAVIIDSYTFDRARHDGRLVCADGSTPPAAINATYPVWHYALEVGDASGTAPDEREDRVFRFGSRDGRNAWVKQGAALLGAPGYRIALPARDPRVLAAWEGDAWPDPSDTLFARRTRNQQRQREQPGPESPQ